MTAEGVDIASLPAVLFPKRMKLPEVPAIYFAVDAEGVVHYVGRAQSLARRWEGYHHRRAEIEAIPNVRLAWLVADPKTLDLLESRFIATLAPRLNHAHPAFPAPGKKRASVVVQHQGRTYLGRAEAAELAGMSRSSFCVHVKKGSIRPAMKVGTRDLFASDDVSKFRHERERLGVKKRGPKSRKELEVL